MAGYLAPMLAALLALSAPAAAQQAEIQQRLTQCGAVGLVMQSVSANPARDGNATAQIRYFDGFGLFSTSIRLIGEVTECAPSFEAVYADIIASANGLQGALVEIRDSGGSAEDIEAELMSYRAQCTAAFGFDVMSAAQARIAREGIGCGWQPGSE